MAAKVSIDGRTKTKTVEIERDGVYVKIETPKGQKPNVTVRKYCPHCAGPVILRRFTTTVMWSDDPNHQYLFLTDVPEGAVMVMIDCPHCELGRLESVFETDADAQSEYHHTGGDVIVTGDITSPTALGRGASIDLTVINILKK